MAVRVAGLLPIYARRMIAQADPKSDRTRLLHLVGLDVDESQDGHRRVPEPVYLDLLETIAEETTGPLDFHIRMGTTMRCDDLGVMGFAFKAAPCLGDSFERFVRYSRLINPVAAFDVLPKGPQTHITVIREGTRYGTYLSNEAALVSVLSVSRDATGTDVSPVEVRYRHAPLPTASALERHFGCPVRYEQAYDALVFEAEVLERVNRVGDDGLHHYFGEQLDQAMAQGGANARIDHRVRNEIADCLADGVPRMATVAARIGMSERTLNRRLGEVGATFPTLVEATRRRLAERLLLETEHGVAEVAFLTGFSEHSAFTRAFKRWTGQAPSAFRRAARGSES